MDNTDQSRVMVTGQVKFLKYIAGLMIMVKMEESLFRKQNRWGRMRVSIKVNVSKVRLEDVNLED